MKIQSENSSGYCSKIILTLFRPKVDYCFSQLFSRTVFAILSARGVAPGYYILPFQGKKIDNSQSQLSPCGGIRRGLGS